MENLKMALFGFLNDENFETLDHPVELQLLENRDRKSIQQNSHFL
jgi:hypothetical protein